MDTLYRVALSNAASATVLAVAVACLGRVFPRRPAVLHCLWLLVLLKLVAPPLYEVSISWPEPLGTGRDTMSAPEVLVGERQPEPIGLANPDEVVLDLQAGSSLPVDGNQREGATATLASRPSVDWTRVASLVWIAGIVTTIAISIGRIRRFQLLLRAAREADLQTQKWVDDLAASLGVERSPSVWWIEGKLSPLVWPLSWRPRLILPEELWKALDLRQRATLIIHELAHLRRGDHYLRFFEVVVTALYWWHPVLWWARRALRDAEEECCDAWVVWTVPDAAKSYAETLLETLDFLDQPGRAEPLLSSGFGKAHHLRKRLTMIMSGKTPRRLGVWGALASSGLAVALLPWNATWAQKLEEKEKTEIRIVVKTDQGAAASADAISSSLTEKGAQSLKIDQGAAASAAAVATTVGEEPELTSIQVVMSALGAGMERVNVVVKADDSATVIAAGSLDEAVKKLTEQIKEIAKKSPQSDKDKALQKALERALKKLEGAAHKVKVLHLDDVKLKLDKQLSDASIKRGEGNHENSAEMNAAIHKLRAKVEELTKDLQSKQRELVEARHKLSTLLLATKVHAGELDARLKQKLEAERRAAIWSRQRSQPTQSSQAAGGKAVKGQVKKVDPTNRRVEIEIGSDDGLVPGHRLEIHRSEQQRIDALEKKLEKLLEEVSSLKKAASKDARTP